MIKSYQEYLEKARERSREYYAKKKADPKFMEKKRLRWRKWRDRQIEVLK